MEGVKSQAIRNLLAAAKAQKASESLSAAKQEADRRVEAAAACVESALGQVESETARLSSDIKAASCAYGSLGEALANALRRLDRALAFLDAAKGEQGRLERLASLAD